MHTIRVWDLPTRLFHWLLAGCVIGLVVTGSIGGNWMNWHLRLGYAVLTLLLILAAQVGTGLMSDDEIAFFGPLVRFVSGDTVSMATSYHKNVGKFIVMGLVALHLMAILFYKLVKKQGLVRPMVVGDKQLTVHVPSANDTTGTRLLALVVLALCSAAVAWMVSLGNAF